MVKVPDHKHYEKDQWLAIGEEAWERIFGHSGSDSKDETKEDTRVEHPLS